ncbi:MAG: alpha/beta hydrolase [Chloroflexi bacterium]|nr:alpha/beta hydrolase [Chloroflexota bacterium]
MSQRPERRKIEGGAIPISYLDWGGDGPPVVLLHGLTASADAWNLTAPLLREHYRVIAVDQRGHGESGKPDEGYTYADVTDDLLTLLDRLGITKTALVGQSWGASVALWAAAHHPERFTALALVDGGFGSWRRLSGDETPQQWESRLAPIEIYLSRETYLAAASENLLDVYSPELEEILLASVHLHPDGSVSEKLSRQNQVLILRAMWEHAIHELHDRVQVPTLLIPARPANPDASPNFARKEAAVAAALAALPNGRVHWAENSVHDIHLHRPHELARVLREHFGGGAGALEQ